MAGKTDGSCTTARECRYIKILGAKLKNRFFHVSVKFFISVFAAVTLMGAAVPPSTPSPANETANGVIFWGVDGEGNYFESLPVAASVDRYKYADADAVRRDFAINKSSEPTIIDNRTGKSLTGQPAREALAEAYSASAASPTKDLTSSSAPASVAAVGFVCSQLVSVLTVFDPQIQGEANQVCSGAHGLQWIESQIQRQYAWYQVNYSNWSSRPSTTADYAYWDLIGYCGSNGSLGNAVLRWNIKPWAISSETWVTVGGPQVYGGASSTNCGTGVG